MKPSERTMIDLLQKERDILRDIAQEEGVQAEFEKRMTNADNIILRLNGGVLDINPKIEARVAGEMCDVAAWLNEVVRTSLHG